MEGKKLSKKFPTFQVYENSRLKPKCPTHFIKECTQQVNHSWNTYSVIQACMPQAKKCATDGKAWNTLLYILVSYKANYQITNITLANTKH